MSGPRSRLSGSVLLPSGAQHCNNHDCGPFEPFTLIQTGPYAAGTQHSGAAIADRLKSSFAIVRFNSRTYESGGVVAVVKAHSAAEHLLRDYEFGQSEQDRHNGWRYFLEETDLVPGMNADEATKLRQARLERRESES
jgi:hypothetical protein